MFSTIEEVDFYRIAERQWVYDGKITDPEVWITKSQYETFINSQARKMFRKKPSDRRTKAGKWAERMINSKNVIIYDTEFGTLLIKIL